MNREPEKTVTSVCVVCVVAMLLLAFACSGCGRLTDPMPGMGNGFWQDLGGISAAMQEHHQMTMYKNAKKDLPRSMTLVEEKIGWVERMKARYDAAKAKRGK